MADNWEEFKAIRLTWQEMEKEHLFSFVDQLKHFAFEGWQTCSHCNPLTDTRDSQPRDDDTWGIYTTSDCSSQKITSIFYLENWVGILNTAIRHWAAFGQKRTVIEHKSDENRKARILHPKRQDLIKGKQKMDIYTINLAGLLAACAGLFALGQKRSTATGGGKTTPLTAKASSEKESSSGSQPSQWHFLVVYALVMGAYWLQVFSLPCAVICLIPINHVSIISSESQTTPISSDVLSLYLFHLMSLS